MKTVLLFLAACGNPGGIPLTITVDTVYKHALADPWIQELNADSDCPWVNTDAGAANRVAFYPDSQRLAAVRRIEHEPGIDGYFDGSAIIMGSPGYREPDMEAFIFLHELGHAVGFVHSGDPHNWMYPEEPAFPLPHVAAQQFIVALGGDPFNTICDQLHRAGGQ